MNTVTHDRDAVSLVTQRFAEDGIRIGRDMLILDPAAYELIDLDEPLQLPMTYVKKMWEEGSLTIDEIFARLTKEGFPPRWLRAPSMRKLLRQHLRGDQQTVALSRRVARDHYDKTKFVRASVSSDPLKQYSCAYFGRGAKNLKDASRDKAQLSLEKLLYGPFAMPRARVLDIGMGYGGLARHFTEHADCEVDGITLSPAQARYAREEMCKDRPVRVHEQDYREHQGQYDRIVTVGMFEHVGFWHYPEFFRKCGELLVPDDGVMLLHTIGGGGALPFYEERIFAGGWLPSEKQILDGIEGTFVVLDWHEFDHYYDPTLGFWADNFEAAWPSLKTEYSEEARREWRMYLRKSQGLDRSGCTKLWQIVLARKPMPDYVPVR